MTLVECNSDDSPPPDPDFRQEVIELLVLPQGTTARIVWRWLSATIRLSRPGGRDVMLLANVDRDDRAFLEIFEHNPLPMSNRYLTFTPESVARAMEWGVRSA